MSGGTDTVTAAPSTRTDAPAEPSSPTWAWALATGASTVALAAPAGRSTLASTETGPACAATVAEPVETSARAPTDAGPAATGAVAPPPPGPAAIVPAAGAAGAATAGAATAARRRRPPGRPLDRRPRPRRERRGVGEARCGRGPLRRRLRPGRPVGVPGPVGEPEGDPRPGRQRDRGRPDDGQLDRQAAAGPGDARQRAAGGRSATARDARADRLGDDRREGRDEGHQGALTRGDGGAVAGALAARPEMPADRPSPQDAAVAVRDRALHRVAPQATPAPGREQVLARLVDELLGRRRADVERLRDLGVGQAAHLPQEEGGALLGPERHEVAPELAQVLARGDLLVDPRAALLLEAGQRRGGPAPPERVQALVVRDAVEPGPHGDLAARLAENPVRAQHHGLERFLALLGAADHRRAVAVQRGPIPPVELLEGPLVAGGDAPRERVVAEDPGRDVRRGGEWGSSRGHSDDSGAAPGAGARPGGTEIAEIARTGRPGAAALAALTSR